MRKLYYDDHQIIKRYLGEHLVYESSLSLEEEVRLKVSTDINNFCFTTADSVLEDHSYNSHRHFLDQTVDSPLSMTAFYDQAWFLPLHAEQTQSLDTSDAIYDSFLIID